MGLTLGEIWQAGDRGYFQMVGYKFNVLFIVFLKMLSESLWKKEKSFLEQQASNISVLKKEITKEAEIDVSVQFSINQKIENLKQNATVLAKKVQNEKHKNLELETIIRHMKGKMDQERQEEASFRDNNNSDNLNSLENKFKKLQYDLGQINGKVNRLSENLEQKRNKISQNRTERVIDSGIFRNIEKELIDSELTFKKLLIEKIRYQKEYEKNVQEYNSLKEKAENYYVRKDSLRTKTHKDISPEIVVVEDSGVNYKRKFLEVEVRRNNNSRYTAQLKIDEDICQQEEQQIIHIKKILIQTNLETCGELLHYFHNIQQINDKYFNEINIYTDQSNEIEKYLAEAEAFKRQRKGNFYHEQPQLTKQQLATFDFKDRKVGLENIKNELERETKQIRDFTEAEGFTEFLKSMKIEPAIYIEDGSINFDILSQTLQMLDKQSSQFLLHESVKIQEEKNTMSRNNNGPQKLQELISKVRKSQECMKVMKKDDFKEQYHKMLKNVTQKNNAAKLMSKKKSFPSIKK